MPPLRPITSAAALSLARSATVASSSAPAQRAAAAALFSTTARRAADAHGPQYDPPTGWLFGVKPGEKPEKEGWEGLMLYGFGGSLLLFSVAYAFKPDTS